MVDGEVTFVAVSAKALMAVACDVNPITVVSGSRMSLILLCLGEMRFGVRSVDSSLGGAEDTSGVCCLVGVVACLG